MASWQKKSNSLESGEYVGHQMVTKNNHLIIFLSHLNIKKYF